MVENRDTVFSSVSLWRCLLTR